MKKGNQKISLCGQWELCWLPLGTGTPEQAAAVLDREALSCPVPGDVHMALTQAGVIPEPLEEENSLACRWLEEQEFWYRRVFTLPPDLPAKRWELVFEGLDTTAEIWLNGNPVGSHNNAFIEKRLDVTKHVHPGENRLLVRIDEGTAAVAEKPLDLMEKSWNAEQPRRAWMRKPQFVYGWDWTIWLPSCGIWKDVTLWGYTEGAIRDVWVRSKLEDDRAVLTVAVETELMAPGGYTLTCEAAGDPRFDSAVTVARQETALCASQPGMRQVTLELPLEKVSLWWPNGTGQPYLYGLTVTLKKETGAEVDRHTLRHGVRTVAIREDALPEGGKSFTFTVNGQRIFCKGANHVPADCFPGRVTPEKVSALLTAAARGNMNMIRVWGGGVYESDGFMALCDELGLMVWHDFMFACAFYPDHDAQFYEQIRQEATAAIRRLRRYACLVGWSGNNEIQEMHHSVSQWNPGLPWYGGRLYEQLLPELVARLCPDRIYRPSSPFGGDVPDSYDQGDQHTWHFTHRPGWEHYLDLWLFTDFDFKFLSEFGIIGAMNLPSAKKCIAPEQLRPDSPQWRHHTNSSMDHSLLDTFVDTYFGLETVRDIQDYTLKSQVIQAEIMRHIYDELRSRKFRCSGVLLWTLSDSYGVHNWSVIDYYLAKRPVYYYLKRAMARLNVAFRGPEIQSFRGMREYTHIWQLPQQIRLPVANDSLTDIACAVQWQVLTFDGRVLAQAQVSGIAYANAVTEFAAVDTAAFAGELVPEEAVLYARVVENGECVSENHYFFAPYGKLRLKRARVEAAWAQDGALVLTADTLVWMAHMELPEGSDAEDNDFLLLPGVPRRVELTGTDRLPEIFSLNPEMKGVNHE